MQKREKILAGIAILSALFFVVNQFVCAKRAPEPSNLRQKRVFSQPGQASQPAGRMQIAGEQISNKALQKRLQNWQPLVTYDSWGSDPFAGGLKIEADSTADSLSLRLSGIVWKGNQALALIGNQIMRPGERYEDFELLQIYRDRIVGRQKGEMITLYLEQDRKYDQQSPH